MTYSFANPGQGLIDYYLTHSKTIAVVGLSDNPDTAAYVVASVLQAHGFTIIPVNPNFAGQTILGETVYARLQDVPVHIDIVDVFRRSEFLPDVARDFIETDAMVFWAQLGLENEEAEKILRDAGREHIVMNKCLKIEYLKMLAEQGN